MQTIRLKRAINRALAPLGYQITRHRAHRPGRAPEGPAGTPQPPAPAPPAATVPSTPPAPKPLPKGGQSGGFDVDDFAQSVIGRISGRTMTSQVKVLGLIDGLRYLHRYGIEGDVVECGVWRGGSMMAAALTLMDLDDTGRALYLYDTFEGMSAATEEDTRRRDGRAATDLMQVAAEDSLLLARASLDDVREGMDSIGYPGPVHYVQGKVEDTIPGTVPERIALLRLDTDWFASTAHELDHLYPRLVPGGVIILDDYGYWDGARKAIDDFLDVTGERLFLVRISAGRIAVKPHG
ncbi:TylF/MycF/NovP-related O-methyltransferase [Intrasporangium sp.]|uniref:TylF/MycF/NovP-related O-methyltransferase n=1 Tax=Intrasporangium sp. TaxID=1925024 RepID=UPI0032217114